MATEMPVLDVETDKEEVQGDEHESQENEQERGHQAYVEVVKKKSRSRTKQTHTVPGKVSAKVQCRLE